MPNYLKSGVTIPFGGGGKINEIYGQIELWQSKATDTGTLTVPKEGGGTVSTSDYSFILDSYSMGVDGICVKLSGGKPIDEVATTTAGVPITVTSIAANGDYVLSAAPPAAIGIIFKIKIKLVNWDLVDEAYIVDRYQIIEGIKHGIASGTDNYAISLNQVVEYVTGDTYVVFFTNTNTGVSTLNINALGAKLLVKNVSDALVVGDIAAGKELIVVYDGTNFQVIGISVEAHTIQIANGSLGTAETTGNKAFIDPTYNFTAISWELTGEIEAGGNASLKIDIQEAGVSLVGAGHTYPQMTAVAVAASPAKASVTGSCSDWTTKVFDMSKHYDFLVDSVTNTERWRLTIYGYRN